jgi:hypothetical protein
MIQEVDEAQDFIAINGHKAMQGSIWIHQALPSGFSHFWGKLADLIESQIPVPKLIPNRSIGGFQGPYANVSHASPRK